MVSENDILDAVRSNPGLTGRQIAAILGVDKKTVNSLLYSLKNGALVRQDDQFRWFSPVAAIHLARLAVEKPSTVRAVQQPQMHSSGQQPKPAQLAASEIAPEPPAEFPSNATKPATQSVRAEESPVPPEGLQASLTPDDPAGELLDRLIELCVACPQYLRKEDALRHRVMLRELKNHQLCDAETSGLSHGSIAFWHPGFILRDTLETFQGKTVGELPIQTLVQAQVLECWIMAYFGESFHPLLPSFALDTVRFIEQHVIGAWLWPRAEGPQELHIRAMVRISDEQRASWGSQFLGPRFKSAFTHRMGTITAIARVPPSCSLLSRYVDYPFTIPTNTELWLAFQRCPLSRGSHGRQEFPDLEISDASPMRYDIGSDFLVYGEVHPRSSTRPPDWADCKRRRGHHVLLPLFWLTHAVERRPPWEAQNMDPSLVLPVPPWEIAIKDPAAIHTQPTVLGLQLTEFIATCFANDGDIELQHYTGIEDSAATILSSYKGDLRLNGIPKLSPNAAGLLAKHEGVLDLNGLTSLPPDLADALARHMGCLSLNGVTFITTEAAEALAKHQGVLFLNCLTSLSDDAADALAKHQGNLYLNGVTSLSDNAFGLLAARKGLQSPLGLLNTGLPELEGLTALSEKGAEILAKHHGMSLRLDRLTSLSEAAAAALSKCSYLSLKGLTSLSVGAAEGLAKGYGRRMLNGLTTVSEMVAQALATSKGDVLSLDGITSISDATAEALAKYRGNLSLNGLTCLSDKAAEALARKQGGLSLKGLRSLSLNAAFSLKNRPHLTAPDLDALWGAKVLTTETAKRFVAGEALNLENFDILEEGAPEVLVKYNGDLILTSLVSISDEAAEVLGKHRHALHLDGLTFFSAKAAATLEKNPQLRLSADRLVAAKTLTLDAARRLVRQENPPLEYYTSISDSAAEELAASAIALKLNGLTSLSQEAANAFAKHKGVLILDGLTSVSDQVAESLAKHQGMLSLGGVPALSKNAAKSLSLHNEILDLSGLTSLSVEQAEHLAQHGGPLWLRVPAYLSPDTAEALATHREDLYLFGLSTLSDRVADALAKHQGSLHLMHVTHLSDYAAKTIARHDGPLWLPKLASLSTKAIAALKKHPDLEPADLDKCLAEAKVLTVESFKRFVAGYPEDLSHFTRTEKDKGWRSFFGRYAMMRPLILDGLTSLSNEAANAFAYCGGHLSLNGLKPVTDEVLEILADHEGGLSLNGVQSISDFAAYLLADHGGDLSLNGLTSLSSEVASKLARRKGRLYLDGLTTISDKAATALSTHQQSLYLNGLISLSPVAAEALANHASDLSLNGLDSLPAASAIVLAKHKGVLCLCGLTSLSEEAAMALAKHEGSLLLLGLRWLSAEAAAALKKTRFLLAPDLDNLVHKSSIGQTE